MKKAVLATAMAVSLCACDFLGSNVETSVYGGNRVNAAGPSQMLEPYKSIEKIDLIATIDPTSQRTKEDLNEDEARAALEKAFANFYASPDAAGNPGLLASRRNQIQDRILVASEQSCNVYQVYLQRLQSETNFLFGGISTVLGGLSTIFTTEGVTRALAGGAAISGGLRAEFNQDFLFGQLVPVITKGIDKKRKDIRRQIQGRRTLESGATVGIESYTLQAAIADAVTYHRGCTIAAALEEATDSLERAGNPGLQEAMRIQYMVNDLQNAANKQKPQFAAYYDPDSPELPGEKNNYVSMSSDSGLDGDLLPAEYIASTISRFRAVRISAKTDAARLSQAADDKRAAIVKKVEAVLGEKLDVVNTSLDALATRLQCLDAENKFTGAVAQARATLAAAQTPENRKALLNAKLLAFEKIGMPIETVSTVFANRFVKFNTALNGSAGDAYEQKLQSAVSGLTDVKTTVDEVLAKPEFACPKPAAAGD